MTWHDMIVHVSRKKRGKTEGGEGGEEWETGFGSNRNTNTY